MTTHTRMRPSVAHAFGLAAALLLATTGPALAQGPAGGARAFVSINGGRQALTSSFSENIVFTESGGLYPANRGVISDAAARESARFESGYGFENAPLFDVSGGVRVGSYFGVGIGVSRSNLEETASVSAQLPHPFFLHRDRAISGDSPPLGRGETAVHLQGLVMVPATSSFTVTAFGGPSLFNVEQQLVTDVNFTHAYPYDTASFSSAVVGRESNSAVGFNVGADVAYYFSRNVGIGWLTRYSRAAVELPSASGEVVEIDAGGLHTAVGLRLRF